MVNIVNQWTVNSEYVMSNYAEKCRRKSGVTLCITPGTVTIGFLTDNVYYLCRRIVN